MVINQSAALYRKLLSTLEQGATSSTRSYKNMAMKIGHLEDKIIVGIKISLHEGVGCTKATCKVMVP
uniref:Uncharacterized protein n=1 Tax=Anguilla anguilla TaxID=7936 RepID=A0A0E9P5S8_ANGAN